MRTIDEILEQSRVIVVVGLSPREERDSHRVAKYLQAQGYRIIPVNPGHDELLGERSYRTLKDVPEPVEVVDVFRSPQHVVPIAEDAVAIGAKALWLQDGVINEAAARTAEEAGLLVVMNDCMLRQHRQSN